MNKFLGVALLVAGMGVGMTGCATAPTSIAERQALVDEAQAASVRFKAQDPGLNQFLQNAYGYAVFPNVGKGGFIAGGAYGHGTVYQGGQLIGYADMSQATVGLQAGGETFAELIVFQNKEALDRFCNNHLEFDANASAVALKPGVSTSAKYTSGVAVFTQAKGGLMFEAAIGGQKFTFVPAQGQAAAQVLPPAVHASAQQPAPAPAFGASSTSANNNNNGASASAHLSGGSDAALSSSAAPTTRPSDFNASGSVNTNTSTTPNTAGNTNGSTNTNGSGSINNPGNTNSSGTTTNVPTTRPSGR